MYGIDWSLLEYSLPFPACPPLFCMLPPQKPSLAGEALPWAQEVLPSRLRVLVALPPKPLGLEWSQSQPVSLWAQTKDVHRLCECGKEG